MIGMNKQKARIFHAGNNYFFKQKYGRYFLLSLGLSSLPHLLIIAAAPTIAHNTQIPPETVMRLMELPPEVIIPAPPKTSPERPFWFNHTLFSRDDSRIFFLGCYPKRSGGWYTSSYTVGADGDSLRCVLGYDWGGSHFDWLSGSRLLVTCYYQGRSPMAHLLFTDTPDQSQRDYRLLGQGMLTQDGHGRFSEDGNWMVTDTYPMHGRRSLMLMRMSDDVLLRLGTFNDYSDTYLGPWRCDLHPAFDITGQRIVFDSVDDGTRQVYLAEFTFKR